MKINRKLITDTRNTIISIISFFCAILFIIFSENIRIQVLSVTEFCLKSIVPSVFPMTFIAYFISAVGFGGNLKKLLHKPLSVLFGLEGNCLEAMLLGLTGGFNISSSAALKLYEQGKISALSAKRCALFFMNPGIAFTVIVTGAVLYNDTRTGIRMYVISVLVCLMTSVLYNIRKRNFTYYKNYPEIKEISDIFVESVHCASSGIIGICFTIILFSVFSEIVTLLIGENFFSGVIIMLTEVSSGISYSSAHYPTFITIFILVFSGVCLYFQNAGSLIRLGISAKDYFSVRLICATLCAAAEYVYTLIFPQAVHTIADNVTVIYGKGSALGSISLIALCIIFLCETKKLRSSPRLRH